MGFFSFGNSNTSQQELPEIFPMPISDKDFISTDLQNIYARILTDALERTQGFADKYQKFLWDNCVANEKSDGLVSLLSKAMVGKDELFLVFKDDVLRKATQAEATQIRADFTKELKSGTGIFISFKNYDRTDMLKLYSALEYCSIASLYKSMNLSKAVQMKMNELRSSVGATDSADVIRQAIALAKSLQNGKDILIDAKDIIETAKTDMSATDSSISFISKKQSLYLGMPASYITGEAPKGLGDSGEGDSKLVERGLKNYYFSIIKPVLLAIFESKTTFKSENFTAIDSANTTLTTFEATSDEIVSRQNKTLIINGLYGLDLNEVGDKPEPVKDTPPVVNIIPPPAVDPPA